MTEEPENEKAQIFFGPVINNQSGEQETAQLSNPSYPYEKGDDVPIL